MRAGVDQVTVLTSLPCTLTLPPVPSRLPRELTSTPGPGLHGNRLADDRTDLNVSTREQMYQRTRDFIARIDRFDSLSETITALTLARDTAHAVVDQRTVRQQRVDGALHEVRTSVVQRESWIRTPGERLLWRVDEIQPGQTLVDGRPLP